MMERAMGIEPTAQAWEAWVLPLYDARLNAILVALSWIRQIRVSQKEGRLIERAPFRFCQMRRLVELIVDR